MLDELIDLAMDLAREVHAEAKAQQQPPNPDAPSRTPDLVAAFDRISRCVRRTVYLAQRLDSLPSAEAQRETARKRIIREVEDAIERRAATDSHKDRLEAELQDRLDSPDLDDDIDNRPIPEIIADICRDLGIAGAPELSPWKRRTPEDIADLCARAARPRPLNFGLAPQPANQTDRPEQPERLYKVFAFPDRD